MKEIIIKPTFPFKDYFLVNLSIYKKIPIVWISLIGFFIFLVTKDHIYITEKGDFQFNGTLGDISFKVFLFLLMFGSLIFSIYRSTKKQIKKNPRINENINYIFNNEYFMEKRESFEVKHFWKNIKKIEEKNNWYLVYVQKLRALVVRKEDLANANKLDEFKELVSYLNANKNY